MTNAITVAVLAVLLGPHQAAAPAAAPDRARAAFATLKELVGEWEGSTPAGRSLRIHYRLIAKDSVLLETWTLGPGRESLTVYHMDGERLVATHYCPIGNQPTLQLVASADPGLLVFSYLSARNLPDPAAAHQHRFEVRLAGKDRFWRNEMYLEGTSEGSEAVTYTRVRPGA